MSGSGTPEGLTIAVGKPWDGPAGDGLIWMPEAGLLVLFVNGKPLTDTEREGLSAPLDLAVLAFQDLVGLAVRLENMGWQDSYAALPPSGVPEHFRGEWGRETRQAITLVAVENGTVAKCRLVSMSPHASRALRNEVLTRWRRLSDGEYRKQVDAVFATYPTTQKAVMALTVARCKAGD